MSEGQRDFKYSNKILLLSDPLPLNKGGQKCSQITREYSILSEMNTLKMFCYRYIVLFVQEIFLFALDQINAVEAILLLPIDI